MIDFNNTPESGANKFIKRDARILEQLFGTTKVEPFWVADMDFPVADPITRELKRLVERGIYAYESGGETIFEAIVDWNEKRHGLSLNGKQFLQVPGVLTGIALLLKELTKPGDAVLIQTPVYHQFFKVIKMAALRIVENPLCIMDGQYEIDFEDLEEKLREEKVKKILFCNPHNPVGRVWKKDELQKITELAERYGATIISDEIHSDVIFPGNSFNSIISIAPDRNVALLGSPAKTFGMQSISNGYIYTENKAIYNKIEHTLDFMYLGHGNAFTTFATIAAFRHGDEWLDELLKHLKSIIDWMSNFLQKELPAVKMHKVEGTYQVWLDFKDTGLSEEQLHHIVFKKAGLGFTPGAWFGKEGELFMRVNIACPQVKVEAAFLKLKTEMLANIF